MSARIVVYIICGGLVVAVGCATEVSPKKKSKKQPASQNESTTHQPAGCATLELSSIPEGATVIIDKDNVVGRTPLCINDVDPGPHRIQIKLDGYHPWSIPVNLAPETTLSLPPARLILDQSAKSKQNYDNERNRRSRFSPMKIGIELREHAYNPSPGCIRYKRVLPIDDTIRIDEYGFAVVESERRGDRTGSRVKWRCDYELDRDSLKSIAVSGFPRIFLKESKKPLEMKFRRPVKHDVSVTVNAVEWRKTVDARLTTSKFIRRLPNKIRQAVGDAFAMDSPESRAVVLRMQNLIARCFRPEDRAALVRFSVSAATGRTYKVVMSQCVDWTDLAKCVIDKVKKTRFPLPANPVCDVRYSVSVYNNKKTRTGKGTEIRNPYR